MRIALSPGPAGFVTRRRAARAPLAFAQMPLRRDGLRGSDQMPEPACILPVERRSPLEVVKRIGGAGTFEQIPGQLLSIWRHARVVVDERQLM
jgi:hypothetical protein